MVFTGTTDPPTAFSALPFASVLTVIDGGVQELVPPLNGTKASARIEYGTAPVTGKE